MSIIGLSDYDFENDLTPLEIREKLDKEGYKPEFRPSIPLGEPTGSFSFKGKKAIFYSPLLVGGKRIQWEQRALSDEEIQSVIPKDLGEKEKEDLALHGIELVDGTWFRWFKKGLTPQVRSPEALPMPPKEEMSAISEKKAKEHPEALPDPERISERGCETLASLGFSDNPTGRSYVQVENPDKEPFPPYMDLTTEFNSIIAETLQDPKVKELAEFMKKSQHIPLDLLDFEWGNGLVKTFLLGNTDISERRIDEISKKISKSLLLGIQKRKFPDPLSLFAPSSPEAWGINTNAYYEKVRDVMSKANAALKTLEAKLGVGEKKSTGSFFDGSLEKKELQ